MNKRTKLIICLILILLLITAIGVCLTVIFRAPPSGDFEPAVKTERTAEPDAPGTPRTDGGGIDAYTDRMVDFAEWREVNGDIYAWIYIPGTRINYPIVQSEDDNAYYLNRDIYRNSAVAGSIFTENRNTTDFTDYNTLIYGHNMKNGTMFAETLNYRDRDFFDGHGEVYIYTPDRAYMYAVFAAYTNDDSHVLAANDFSSGEGFLEYIGAVMSRGSGNFGTETEFTAEDRIITLSTCTSGGKQRYLTQAVLRKVYAYEEQGAD